MSKFKSVSEFATIIRNKESVLIYRCPDNKGVLINEVSLCEYMYAIHISTYCKMGHRKSVLILEVPALRALS